MNIRAVGPNLEWAPAASPSDGLLSVVMAREADRQALSAYIADRLAGRDARIELPSEPARCVDILDEHVNSRLHRLPLIVRLTHFHDRIAHADLCVIDKTLVRLMSLNHLRSERFLEEVDKLRRANRVEVKRDAVQIRDRSFVKAFCDVPLVAADVPHRGYAFAVLLIGRRGHRSRTSSDRARGSSCWRLAG